MRLDRGPYKYVGYGVYISLFLTLLSCEGEDAFKYIRAIGQNEIA